MKFISKYSLALFSVTFFLCKHSFNGQNMPNQTDYLSLLEFKKQITDDPNEFLNSWNSTQHYCKWQGITCGRKHQRVVELNISGQDMFGIISPHIGNLSFLRSIDLQRNNFHGHIPQQISQLFRLRFLVLSNNTLGGHVPANLSRCFDLVTLDFYNNRLVGSIPKKLSSLKKLERFILGRNNFTGSIPRIFGNLSSLRTFGIGQNNFEGTIPSEFGRLKGLTFFSVCLNNLTGTIPSSLYNSSTLIRIYACSNQFVGTFPSDVGLTLPNLQIFNFGENNFHGEIPSSIVNISDLQRLTISKNRLTGQVSVKLGHLKYLEWLLIGDNLLGSNATNDLSFITSLSNCTNLDTLDLQNNNFGGEIPSSIGNLTTQLLQFSLGSNHLTGTISSALENFGNVYLLDISDNLLLGFIPSSLGKLRYLQSLDLGGNKLSGQIPSSLGNITRLYSLNISYNYLEGNIPESLGNCEELRILDLSQNNLIGFKHDNFASTFSQFTYLNLSGNSMSGYLPLDLGTMKNIQMLDVSDNRFTGNIPGTIGECLSLEYLYIQGNFFQGKIPSTLTDLKGIQRLDLSRNNLSGKIPEDMAELPFLSYLNLSFNNFEGEVPTTGVFENAYIVSVVGNSKLCGGVKELKLKSCKVSVKKPRLSLALKIVLIASGVVFFFILFIAFFYSRRKSKNVSSLDVVVKNLLRVSYQELYRATQGFSANNLIGSGSFGSVYQGKLNEEEDRLVAVKVLNLENARASKSFLAECRALRNIRHRNLVKILTYCSSIDFKQNQFKALVYEFMDNGSLDMRLHPRVQESSRSLSLLQRLNIALDVGNAIHYLHDLCEPSIIHCDLKPSNILLDSSLVAHVGDFGLAKLLFKSADTFAQEQSSSMVLNGTFGYVAPEYGMGAKASKFGDVYSYGVLLLEMMTGRRPTNERFKDGLNLHDYVKTALEEQQVMRIVDETLVTPEENSGETVVEEHSINAEKLQKDIVGVAEIGLACSVESPNERMNMNDVLKKLTHIKNELVT